MVIAYLNGSCNSFSLVHQLDDREIPYEAKTELEASELGYRDLPILVVDNKVMKYKKAMKWLRKRGE